MSSGSPELGQESPRLKVGAANAPFLVPRTLKDKAADGSHLDKFSRRHILLAFILGNLVVWSIVFAILSDYLR